MFWYHWTNPLPNLTYDISGLWHYNAPWKASRLSADLMEPANKILGITYSIKGTENIDKKKAYVIVCNHQSSVDVLTTMQVSQSLPN